MSVFKKGDNWFIRFRLDGKRVQERIGPSKALAEKVYAKRVIAIAEGHFLDVRKEKHFRFEEAASRFIEYSKTNKKSHYRDECIIRRNLLPVFGRKNLDEITSWDVERYKARRRLEVSPASVNRELSCLKSIFYKAMYWKLVKENPVRGVKLFKENNRRLRFLAPDEARRLVESCAPHLRPIVIVALNTGMRRGEILNLRWGDVHLDRGQLTIRDSKNGESRTVELNQQVIETLGHLEGRSKNLLVFPSRHGEPYYDILAIHPPQDRYLLIDVVADPHNSLAGVCPVMAARKLCSVPRHEIGSARNMVSRRESLHLGTEKEDFREIAGAHLPDRSQSRPPSVQSTERRPWISELADPR